MSVSNSLKPLHGLTLATGDFPPVPAELVDTPRGEVWGATAAATAASKEYAQHLGARVVPLAEGMTVGTSDMWMLYGDGDAKKAVKAEKEMLQLNPDIHAVSSQPFAECDEAELREQLTHGKPFVLSYRQISMGHGKYPIHETWQLETFLRFLEAHQDDSSPEKDYMNLFHVRELIETPSNHYSSYRFLTTGSGDILAATLHYSGQKKSDAGVISLDNRAINASSMLAGIKDTLENPHSSFYLGAQDIRSNLATSGKSIPLMGGNKARPINSYERGILIAHDIDPDNIVLPEGLVASASRIGRIIAPQLDIVVGLDFLQNLSRVHRYLETNAAPGDMAFRECWRGGAATTSTETATAMRLLALDAVAKWRMRG